MSIRLCPDISDAIALESSLNLYLKPASKIKINVQLPKLKSPDQSISSYHVMEKLRTIVRPDEFIFLRALKITPAVIKLEGELDTKSSCDRALSRLKTSSSLKLSGFSDWLHIRAAHAPPSGPTRHDWEAFYRDAKGVNEMRPGERPDTIHLQELPVKWFAEDHKPTKPNERLLRKTFMTFGKVRRLEIPVQSIVENSSIGKTNSLQNTQTFEAFVQYEEYVEFAMAMDALRGKKLIYKDSNGEIFSADIKVDFDKTNYLSDKCIKQREIEVQKSHFHEENESISSISKKPVATATECSPTKVDSSSNIKEKQSENNARLSKAGALCLLKELLLKVEKTEKRRIQHIHSKVERTCTKTVITRTKAQKSSQMVSKKRKSIDTNKYNKQTKDAHPVKNKPKQGKHKHQLQLGENERKSKLLEQERLLKEKLLRNLKAREEQKILQMRENLKKKLTGRKLLKSVLTVTNSSK